MGEKKSTTLFIMGDVDIDVAYANNDDDDFDENRRDKYRTKYFVSHNNTKSFTQEHLRLNLKTPPPLEMKRRNTPRGAINWKCFSLFIIEMFSCVMEIAFKWLISFHEFSFCRSKVV